MLRILNIVLFAGGVLAQVAPPPQNPSGTPQIPPGILGRPPMGLPHQAKPAEPPVSPDTVVATIDGKAWTAAQMDELLSELPVRTQGIIQQQPATFVQQFLNFKALEKKAEDEGLDKKDPYKQELFYNRMMVLANAEGEKARNAIVISPDDEHKYYETNKDALYRVAKTKVIYVGFTPAPAAAKPGPGVPPVPAVKPPAPATGPATRTEAEAKAKIEELRKQILAGADFGKLAAANSDDKASAAKDGDYGDIMRSSPYPAQIKDAIFRLKAGEVSEPIAQPSGYYLIKAVDISNRPYADVEEQIRTQLTNEQFKIWQDEMHAHNKVTVEVPTYFSNRQPK